jgi:hypothetical protein
MLGCEDRIIIEMNREIISGSLTAKEKKLQELT